VHFIDGTKIRADANRNKVVWKKNVDRHKERINNRIHSLLKEIDDIDEEEIGAFSCRSKSTIMLNSLKKWRHPTVRLI